MAHINLKVKAVEDHGQKPPQKSHEIANIKELRKEAEASFNELINSLNKFSELSGLTPITVDPRLKKVFIDNTIEPGKNKFKDMEIELHNQTVVLPASVQGTYKIPYIAKEIAITDGHGNLQKAKTKSNVDKAEVNYHEQEMHKQLIGALQALSKGKEPLDPDKVVVTVDQHNLDMIAERVARAKARHHDNHVTGDDNSGHGLPHRVGMKPSNIQR